MKTLTYFSLLNLLIGSPFFSMAQEESRNEFLFAVVEFSLDSSWNEKINIAQSAVLSGSLKRPTKEQPKLKNQVNSISIHITDEVGNILDEVFVPDPYVGRYEYVGEDGKLARHITRLEKNAMVVRRPITSNATHLKITRQGYTRNNISTSIKFR